ncbi:MAG TPA: hypothetical protein VMV12_05190 [Candidatus Micrarchaeaceae archaeon]|nr:hypothetical protein [Candidatus Micrarchaeaceae archaeon]
MTRTSCLCQVRPCAASKGQKGTAPESSWHRAEIGKAHLRTPFQRIAVVGSQHDPVIFAHYRRKSEADKSRMNAVGHCLSKSLRLV